MSICAVPQPIEFTVAPAAVFGHWSVVSNTPSWSVSATSEEQPCEFTGNTFPSTSLCVPGQISSGSTTPSWSVSEQPTASIVAPVSVAAHWSAESNIPSESSSASDCNCEHPNLAASW